MDGGRWVCGLSRLREEKDCVVYSFGQLEESSFEAEILLRTKGCKVFGYDDRTKNVCTSLLLFFSSSLVPFFSFCFPLPLYLRVDRANDL